MIKTFQSWRKKMIGERKINFDRAYSPNSFQPQRFVSVRMVESSKLPYSRIGNAREVV